MAVDAQRLRKAWELYQRCYDFKPGDLVRWKPGLKDRKLPLADEPAIVVKRLEQPVFDATVGAGSPYFNIPYDMVLGVFDADGDFMTYHFCSERFEPFDVR